MTENMLLWACNKMNNNNTDTLKINYQHSLHRNARTDTHELLTFDIKKSSTGSVPSFTCCPTSTNLAWMLSTIDSRESPDSI